MSREERISRDLETPFQALFGVAPTTLAALENPELLPATSPAEVAVRETAMTLAKLQARLKVENDILKRAAAAADTSTTRRRLVPGDRVWLTYSDSERARYLRKHGHGKAWRHPFVVEAVKPHAVRLTVPKDGSVPEVLPWQSLRKCALAAPHFHDPELPTPDVNEHGLPMMPQSDDTGPPPVPEPTSTDWDPEESFEIDRIVSAVRLGRGWQLQVKWKGYQDTTPEPLSKILKQTNHPDILRDIARCKDDYYLMHPSARDADERDFDTGDRSRHVHRQWTGAHDVAA
jgi:hypothetical protein